MEDDDNKDVEQAGGAADILRYWRQIRPYIWVVPLVALAASGAAFVYTSRLPRIYEAVSTLEYDPNPPRPLGSQVQEVSEGTTSYWSSRELLETQNLIIGSRVIAERVVRQLGLNEDPTFPSLSQDMPASWHGMEVADAAAILQARVTIVPVDRTRIVEVHVRDRAPERAALIANAIVDAYVEKTIEDRLGSTVSALEWLSEQLDNLRGDLNTSELALHAFWEEHDILSVSMEDRQNLVAGQLEAFSTALTTARQRRIELRARLSRLRELASLPNVDDIGAGFEDYETIQTLQESLRTKLVERESLSLRYGPAHPRILEADHEIEAIRQTMHDEIAAVIRSVEAELREAHEIEVGLEHAVDEANAAGLELNLLSIEYARLDRDRENQAHLYEMVLERTTETELTRMLRTTHVRVVDRALQPGSPVSPHVPINLGAGAVGGLVLGVALALLLARLDRRIKTVHQVEELGLTVLGVIPEIGEAAKVVAATQRRGRRSRREPQEPTSVSRDLLAHTHPMSSAAESLRTVRTNLMFMAGESPLRSLVVTSGSPREGKTTIATNLAISIAQSGKRVLIIDTDMRRPRLHQAFGVDGRPGLTNILVGDASLRDLVRQTEVPGLFMLPCGPVPPNPSELLHRERFQQLTREVAALYDFVIYDSPPLGPVTDAAVLARQVDGVVVVVKAQQTTTDSVRSLLRQLRDVRANIVGGIINGFDPRHSRYGGSYYYYYRGDGYASNQGDDDPPEGRGGPDVGSGDEPSPTPPTVN